MEIALRAALIAWLAADPNLSSTLNTVTEEASAHSALPWLAIASSASNDWGCNTADGREVRVALELHCRGDTPDAAADTVRAIERSIEGLPRVHGDFEVASTRFLRARAERRGENRRAILLEYRFRLLAR